MENRKTQQQQQQQQQQYIDKRGDNSDDREPREANRGGANGEPATLRATLTKELRRRGIIARQRSKMGRIERWTRRYVSPRFSHIAGRCREKCLDVSFTALALAVNL